MLAIGKMKPDRMNVGSSEISRPIRKASACESTSVDTSSPVPRAPTRKSATAAEQQQPGARAPAGRRAPWPRAMMSNADEQRDDEVGDRLADDVRHGVEIGAMRTCSQVPRSFSRTIDSEVETTALIITMKPMRPGTRNSVLCSSGLYQMRGSTAMGGAQGPAGRQLELQLGRHAPHDGLRVAEDGGGRVGVVAVDDDLHDTPSWPLRRSRLMPSGMTSATRALAAVHQPLDLAHRRRAWRRCRSRSSWRTTRAARGCRRCARGPSPRAARAGCRSSGRSRRASGRTPARTGGSAASADRGRSAQNSFRPTARAFLMPRSPPARSTTSMNTSSSDGWTSSAPSTERPSAAIRCQNRRGGALAGPQPDVQRRAEEARLLDRRQVVERAQRRPSATACGLRRPPDWRRRCLSSLTVPSRRDPAGVHQRQPVAVLGFVEVVGGDEHGDALAPKAGRSAARTGGARPGRRRPSARRGRGCAARGGWRSPGRGAAATRRRDRA